jgi:hypothetical protein
MNETITWTDANIQLPDDNTTVLIFAPGADEPVWMGYHEYKNWYYAEGDALKPGAVTHWATFPNGPNNG